MTKVLLADDDVELVDMLREYLEREDYVVTVVHDGAQAVSEALTGHHAIAVLDIMMPYMNGIEALRRIRAQSRMPVLMLTAKGDDVDRIIGLELGADDYVPKPCTPRELLARIRAILRRTQSTPGSDVQVLPLVIGALSIWQSQRRAEWSGQPLELTSTEFTLLEILARNAGRTVSKNDLSEQGLGRPLTRFDRNIDVHLSSIRQKLGPLTDGRAVIQTVYRQGYMLTRE
ncbi:response regulator [Undibacterium sp. RuTC16W]|uniref:response regulator n=1 Tax=Undibacterium sp. RuTC16W TaxID=3413048 RepID=UPI003BEFB820